MGKAATAGNASAGFRSTGMVPYNPEIFPEWMYAPAAVTDRPAPDATVVTAHTASLSSDISASADVAIHDNQSSEPDAAQQGSSSAVAQSSRKKLATRISGKKRKLNTSTSRRTCRRKTSALVETPKRALPSGKTSRGRSYAVSRNEAQKMV